MRCSARVAPAVFAGTAQAEASMGGLSPPRQVDANQYDGIRGRLALNMSVNTLEIARKYYAGHGATKPGPVHARIMVDQDQAKPVRH